MHRRRIERQGEMADKKRSRINNLLGKLNDEDRNSLVCLIAKAGYAVRIGKERPDGRKQAMYYVEFWEEENSENR